MGRFSEIIQQSDFPVAPDTSKNPDQFAADQDLAKQTGLPVDYVERNRAEAEQIKRQNIDYSKYADTELGGSLTDPEFSNLAQDDLDNLSYLERTFKGLGTTIAESVKQGVKGVALSAIEDGVKPATSAMMPGVYDPFVSDIYDERAGGDFTADVKQAAAGIAIESIKQNEEAIKAATPEGLDVLQKGIRSGVQSLAQMAPGLAASLATRSSAPMLTMAGVQSYGDSYAAARSKGLSPEESGRYAMVDAGIEVATEKLPADKLLKITGEFGNQTLKQVVRFLVTEGATEQVATFLQSMNAWHQGLDEELDNAKDAEEIARIQAERQAVTLISTIVAGGAQSGVAAGVGYAANKLDKNQPLKELKATAEQSNLKRRSPEQFRQFLQAVDPLANIFIPASALEGVTVTPDNPTMKLVADQLPQARALNGDIVVPVADVMTDIPQDVFDAVYPYMRVDADGVAEIEDRPDMKALIEEVNRDADNQKQAKAFRDKLTSWLTGTGRVTTDEAKKSAAIVSARIETLAIDKGMTFDEAIQRYIGDLKVVGPDVAIGDGAIMDQAKAEGYEGDVSSEAAEWVYAKAKGLDMSQAARMQRAAEQGFDTGKVWYHGTKQNVESFSPSLGGLTTRAKDAKDAIFLASNPDTASHYAEFPSYDYNARDFLKDDIESLAAAEKELKSASTSYDRLYKGSADESKIDAAFNIYEAAKEMVSSARDNLTKKTIEAAQAETGSYGFVSLGAAQEKLRGSISGRNVMPLYTSLKNPIVYDAAGKEYNPSFMAKMIKNARDNGHDGLIVKNTKDPNSTDVQVIFDPSNIRSKFAAFDPAQKESPNLLAQSVIDHAIKEDKNLFVAHNLSEQNLLHALELGGLAAPSLAIAKAGTSDFTGYGEITLLAKPDLVESPKARTFDSDAYSPRHPRAHYKVDQKRAIDFVDGLRPAANEAGGLRIPNIDEMETNGARELQRSEGLQYAWLKEQGKAPKIIKKSHPQHIKDGIKIATKEKVTSDWQLEENPVFREFAENYFRNIGSQYEAAGMPNVFVDDGEVDFRFVQRLAKDVIREINNGGVDSAAMHDAISKKFRNKKLREDFDEYVTTKFNEIHKGQQIFKGFTNSGNKKYIPYTLENVVNEMTQKLKAGEGFNYGAGNIRAAFAHEFKSLEEIKQYRDNIISSGEFEKIKDESRKKLEDALDALRPFYKFDSDSWGYADDASSAIAEGSKGQAEAFRLTNESRKIISDLVSYMRSLPTEYFETKVQRAVSLSEFDTAVVPSDIGKEALQALKDAGLKIKKYKRDGGVSRKEVIEQQNKLFFQSANQTETEAFKKWFGDSKVVDENGNPLVVYHGSDTKFNTFEMGRKSSRGVMLSSYDVESHAAFFSPSEDDAGSYGGVVRPFYLSVQNPLVSPDTLATSSRMSPDEKTAVAKVYDDVEYILAPAIYEDGGTRYIDTDNGISRSEVDADGNWIRKVFIDNELDWSFLDNQEIVARIKERGYDGVRITEPNDSSGYSWAVFSPTQIKSATGNRGTFDPNDPSILNQKERGLISISDKEIVIKLTNASNASTFIHEAGHLFLEIESRIAKLDGISEQQQKMLSWLGVNSFDEIGVEQHEKFARGFEAHAMEGRAPSADLVEVFRSFARWLKKVYSSMKSLNVELNDDIRQFFDRMLSADQAIKDAERLNQYSALFKDAKTAGMTEAEYADYQAHLARANSRGNESLQSKLLKELTRQTEKWWKESLAAERDKATETLGEQPIYRATRFLSGDMLDDPGYGGFDKYKMDVAATKAILGDGVRIPEQLRGMTEKGGLHPDEVAALFDFASGQDMIQQITSAPTLKQAAATAAQAAMIEQHGDILNDGTLQQEADISAHNEERGKLILSELRALNRKTGADTINRDALKFSAKEVIGKSVLKDIHPGKYRTAEVRAAREAATALAKKNYKAAATAKLKQATNFYMYREAMDAKRKEQSWRRYLKSVQDRKYSTKEVNPDYVRQMKMLAAVYDFRKNGSSSELLGVAQWLKAQADVPDAAYVPQVLDSNLIAALDAADKGEPVTVKHYRDMTLDELQGVYDMVKHLRWVGGQMSENEKAKRVAEYERVGESIQANSKKGKIEQPRQTGGKVQAIKEGVSQYKADYFPLPDFIERLDGFQSFGPAFNLIYDKVIDSSNVELKLRRETAEKATEIFKEFGSSDFAPGKASVTITTEAGDKLTLDRRGRIMMALYHGSQYSRDVMMQGDNLTLNDINSMLSHLTNKELDLVEAVWALNESFWPQVAEVSRRMTGIVPPKREVVPFAVNGRVMPGGYMRLFYMYDTRDSHVAVSSDEGKITRTGDRLAKQTKHGGRMEVVGSGGRKVQFEVSNIFKALDETIHDIAFAETARDSMAALTSKQVSSAIVNYHGKDVYESMLASLSGVIAGNQSSGGWFNNMMRHFRTAQTYAMLGYSIRNLVQQPASLPNVWGYVGFMETNAELIRMWAGGHWKQNIEFVQSKSEFMKNRTALVNRDTAEIMGSISGNVMSSRLKRHAFDLQTMADGFVGYPAWMAQYKKSLAEFESDPMEVREKKAIKAADEAVARTIGSGLMKDMSPMLQGGGKLSKQIGPEMLKSLTFMGSYMATVGRLIARANANRDFKTVGGVSKYSREMFFYLVAPALMSALLTGAVPDDDDDEGWAEWTAKTVGKYGLSTVFGLRDIVQVASGYGVQNSYGRALEQMWRSVDIAADVAAGEKEADLETSAKMLRASSGYFTIPFAYQAARTMEYIDSQQDGNEGDFNIYKALVVGKERD